MIITILKMIIITTITIITIVTNNNNNNNNNFGLINTIENDYIKTQRSIQTLLINANMANYAIQTLSINATPET